jgi:hypothetical protein
VSSRGAVVRRDEARRVRLNAIRDQALALCGELVGLVEDVLPQQKDRVRDNGAVNGEITTMTSISREKGVKAVSIDDEGRVLTLEVQLSGMPEEAWQAEFLRTTKARPMTFAPDRAALAFACQESEIPAFIEYIDRAIDATNSRMRELQQRQDAQDASRRKTADRAQQILDRVREKYKDL